MGIIQVRSLFPLLIVILMSAILAGVGIYWVANKRKIVPLYRSERLTQLPEYIRRVRLQKFFDIAVLSLCILLMVTEGILLGKPYTKLVTKTPVPKEGMTNYVMICTDQPLNDPGTSAILNYFSPLAKNMFNLFAITSATTRVYPFTHQNWLTSKQLAFYGHAFDNYYRRSSMQNYTKYLRARFYYQRKIKYNDYTPNYFDVLASCLYGFPDSQDADAMENRSILYYGTAHLPYGVKPLYSMSQLTQIATERKVRVNAISYGYGFASSNIQKIIAATDGHYETIRGKTTFSSRREAEQARKRMSEPIEKLYNDLDHTPDDIEDVVTVREVDAPNFYLIISLLFMASLTGVMYWRQR